MNSEKFEIIHMLPYIQHYTSRDEHIPIRTVQTDVTFVWKKKLRYILQGNSVNTLNQRTKIVSTCRQKAK